MRKIWTVIKREYLTRVKTKGFIIGTIIMPLFVLALFVVPILMSLVKSEDQREIAVIDRTGTIAEKLEQRLDATNDTGERLYVFREIEVTDATFAAAQQQVREEIDADKYQGLIIIPATIFTDNKAEYYSKNVSNFRRNQALRNAITEIVLEEKILQAGLDRELVNDLTRRVRLQTFRIGPGGQEKADRGQTFMLAYIMVFFLYFAIIFYAAFVMRAVIEEKNSRVVEVLVSSLKPFQLMAGKILGVGSVGLTQFLIWSAVAGLASAYASVVMGAFGVSGNQAAAFSLDVSAAMLVYFVLFFVLGYFLFATMNAGVGAMVNTEQEAQQFQFPIILLLIIPFIMITYIISNPNSTFSVIMSMVPFFAPIIMFTRIIVDTPPFGQIALSIALMLGTIYLLTIVVGKIYRVGILMYGKKPSVPEVIRWIRYS